LFMSNYDVDLFVIGAGSGGVRAARIAAGYGAKVSVAEEFRIGGTCVIRGCVPKKLYVYASRFRDDFEDAAGFGWQIDPMPRFEWARLVAVKEKEITRLSGLYAANLQRSGVTLIEQRAQIVDAHHVRLRDGTQMSARYILVATGATPSLEPAIEGMNYALSSNEIFDLPTQPQRLLVVGSGYIALEFASLFQRLGTQVTLAFRADKVLRGFDEEVRTHLTQSLSKSGIMIAPHTLPTAIVKQGSHYHVTLSDGSTCDVDQILLATGRKPNIAGLGLEQAGVKTAANGAILVSGISQTSVPSIHAVGDVTDRVNLTPVAIREGHGFADQIFGGLSPRVDHDLIPTAVFTTPEVGTLGLSEEQAAQHYDVVDIYTTSFRPMRATLSGRDDKIFMKLVVDGVSERVLGVHIIGHEAGEMIQLLGIAVRMGARKSDFDATMAVHPTAAEELVTMRTRTRRLERDPK
jgi:glutathione reductase (NADPH)